MRNKILAAECLLLIGLCAFLAAQPQDDSVAGKLRLIDADTGKNAGGIVRVFRAGSKEPLPLPGLYDRLKGLTRTGTVAGWHVVPAAGAEVQLARAALRLEALAGLETAPAEEEIDRAGKARSEIAVKLRYLFRPEQDGLAAGNTHLHLRNLTRAVGQLCLLPRSGADRCRSI
jgi:hypothetical protein